MTRECLPETLSPSRVEVRPDEAALPVDAG
jgi:hypothetical protein